MSKRPAHDAKTDQSNMMGKGVINNYSGMSPHGMLMSLAHVFKRGGGAGNPEEYPKAIILRPGSGLGPGLLWVVGLGVVRVHLFLALLVFECQLYIASKFFQVRKDLGLPPPPPAPPHPPSSR